MIPRTEAVIVGAGIGGLAAALALQKIGLDVRVYEQAPALGEVGAGISIGPNGALGLRALGVAQEFREFAYAPDYQLVRHFQTARVLATVSRGERLAETYGERYYTIHRADLHQVLARAVIANDPDSIITSHKLVDLQTDGDGMLAHFDGGRSRRADLLIGADGVRSRVRSLLFGAEEVRFTGFVAWRGLVPMDRVSIEAMDPPSQVFIGPGHLINRYPVRGGKLLNFVAFAERSGWEEEGWSIPAEVTELAAEFKDWHPWVTGIIDAVPQDNLFKWALCARSALTRWVKGSAAVLGDAAHPLCLT